MLLVTLIAEPNPCLPLAYEITANCYSVVLDSRKLKLKFFILR